MATLTVKIIESCTLNGADQGGTYSGFSNANITQIMKKYKVCCRYRTYIISSTR